MGTGRRSDDTRPNRKVLWILGAAVVVLCLLWFLFAPGRGYVQYRKLQREIDSLNKENSRLEAKNTELVEDIKRLKSDEAYIEDVARKKHGLLKKDEMVYEFEPAKKKK
jgi:cell division protein FtsB